MSDDAGEDPTRALFRSVALERQGYYDSRPGGPPRLSFWQKRIRKTVESILDARLDAAPPLRRVLDAGCGRGDFTLAMADRYPKLEEILGCDFSPELLDLARKSAAGRPRIRFATGELSGLPYADADVDASVCLNVLHHIPHDRQRAALLELARVSKSTLLLEIKNARSPYFRMHSQRVEGIAIFPSTVETIERGLRPAGFKLVRGYPIFGLTWLSPLVVLHFERALTAASTADRRPSTTPRRS
jgi:ubiquinone/menaquinone biosynthesis C-methylase UbiE